jgi:hypothetical protein
MNDNMDYSVPAELFPGVNRRHLRISYHRFESLAEAVRFAVEELKPAQLAGAFIEAEEVRYGEAEIAALYHASGFPLPRRTVS